MVDAWPGGLPQRLLIDGYSEGVADNLVEYPTDTGPPQTRRRSTAGARPLAAQIQVTRAQLATLRTFVETTLLGGALPFTLPAQTEAGTWLVKFAKQGLPKWSAIGGDYYQVQFGLNILP
jgi:hypothetical protein